MSNFDPLAERWELLQRQPEIVLPEQLGLTSDNPALFAVQDFSLRVHEPRALDHPLRVAKILHDFAGTMLPQEAFEATLLHDVVERAEAKEGLQTKNAKQVLLGYFDGMKGEEDKSIYVSSLLADMSLVEEAAETYRTAENEDPHLKEILSGNTTDQAIKVQHWMEKSRVINVETMHELLEQVNLESVLIKAAELLDNLTYVPPKDRSLIQDIFEAESFYAPLCEILGFDGLSMALRDAAARNRSEKSGNTLIQAQALEMRDNVIDAGSIDSVVEAIFGDNALTAPVLGQLSDHGVRIDEVIASLNGAELAGVARVKSVGSLALKLARGAGERPMDIVGMTFVANDVTEASIFFHALLARLKNIDVAQLQPAPSRKEAVHIRGDSSYISEYTKHMDPDIEVDEKPEEPGAYQVAKVTALFFGVIPVEIQVQTKDDRKNGRIGTASHTTFKDGGTGLRTELLGSIYDRKRRLARDRINVNGQSIARGLTLLQGLR